MLNLNKIPLRFLVVFSFVLIFLAGCTRVVTVPVGQRIAKDRSVTRGYSTALKRTLDNCVRNGGRIMKTDPPRCVRKSGLRESLNGLGARRPLNGSITGATPHEIERARLPAVR